MANDQNRSNKGPQNQVNDSMSDIENIGRRAARHTAEDIAQRVRLSEARRNIGIYEEGLQSGPPDAVAQMLGRQLANERRTVNSLEPRIELRAETQRQRFTSLTQSAIERNFQQSSVNGQAAEFGRSSSGQRMSLGMMNSSYDDLEARRASAMNSIGALGQRASNIAENLYNDRGQQDPARLAQLNQIYNQRNRLVNVVGGIDAAQRQLRSLGQDPTSRQDALFAAGASANRTLFREGLANEMASGQGELGSKSAGELKQREIQLSQQLVEALEKLKDSAGRSAEEVDKLKESAEKTAEDLEKVKEARGMVGGGGGSNAGSYLNFASGAFSAIGNGIQQIGVNQRLGQTANTAGYAGIENQKYGTYRSAAGGDVASQLLMSQYGDSESFGRSLRTAANAAQVAYTAGGVAQVAAGGVRTAASMNPLENAVGTSGAMGQRLQGIGEVIQGGVNTAVSATDLMRDVSGSNASISGTNAQVEARRAIQAITAQQMQGFRDYSVSMGVTAQGMGAAGAGFVDRMVNKGMIANMVSARISPEQMSQLTQQGVQQVGSTFNEGQIFGARGLERSGFGSMGENMSRMATLAGAGSNNPQAGLASVLESSFSKSLEGAKVLNMMVENTAQLVQNSAGRAMGIDTTAAASQILAAGVNTADPNQEFAVNRAANAAQRMQALSTDTGVNFAAMSATARISKMTGISGTEAVIAQGLDDATLRSMKSMDPNKIRESLFDRGINVQSGKEREFVNNLTKARLITNLQGGGAGLATGVNATEIADKISRGEKLTQAEQLSYNQAATLGGFAGGAEARRAATAVVSDAPNKPIVDRVSGAMAGQGGSEQQRMLDDMRTQGFKQLSQAALEATASFKTAGDALKALGALAKSVEDIGDTGGEGKFKTAAADSAKSFGESTMKFRGSVDDFSKAVDMMMRNSGIPSYNDPSYIDKVDNKSSRQMLKGQ